jgi:hypothetical protein
MEKYFKRHHIHKNPLKGIEYQFTNNKPEECNMDCVSLCFKNDHNRLLDIIEIDKFCLIA